MSHKYILKDLLIIIKYIIKYILSDIEVSQNNFHFVSSFTLKKNLDKISECKVLIETQPTLCPCVVLLSPVYR